MHFAHKQSPRAREGAGGTPRKREGAIHQIFNPRLLVLCHKLADSWSNFMQDDMRIDLCS